VGRAVADRLWLGGSFNTASSPARVRGRRLADLFDRRLFDVDVSFHSAFHSCSVWPGPCRRRPPDAKEDDAEEYEEGREAPDGQLMPRPSQASLAQSR